MANNTTSTPATETNATTISGSNVQFTWQTWETIDIPDEYEMLLYVIYFLLILGGNMWVIIAVIRQPKLRQSATNLFIISLSISDLFFGLFDMPYRFIREYIPTNFAHLNSNLFVCYFFVWIQYTARCATVNSLVGVAIDRYRAIVQPMKPRITRGQGVFIISIIWIAAGLYGVRRAAFLILQVSTFNDYTYRYCRVDPDYMEWYPYLNIADFLVMYVIPVGIASTLYAIMVKALWFSKGPSNASNRNKKKAVKMLSLVALLFAISWLPYYIYSFYYEYAAFSAGAFYTWQIQWHIAHNLYSCNSFINPFLFAYFNENFRREFFKMFPCLKPVLQRKVGPDSTTGSSMRTTKSRFNSTATAVSTVSQANTNSTV